MVVFVFVFTVLFKFDPHSTEPSVLQLSYLT